MTLLALPALAASAASASREKKFGSRPTPNSERAACAIKRLRVGSSALLRPQFNAFIEVG
jgi:hypothetical protein